VGKPSYHAMFSQIMGELGKINAKMGKVMEIHDYLMREKKQNACAIKEFSFAFEFLMRIPKHLRKTLVTLSDLGGFATTSQVQKKTGMSRALESWHLNELTRLGYLVKRQEGTQVVFSVSSNLREVKMN